VIALKICSWTRFTAMVRALALPYYARAIEFSQCAAM